MSQEIIALAPEQLDIANAYIQFGSAKETAYQLQIPEYQVIKLLERKDVRDYVTQVYLDRGYRNRHKLGDLLDKIIESKLEEAADTGVYSSKDLLEILKFAHQIRLDESKMDKADGGGTTVNIANVGYSQLMERLLK